jgi:GPH family glycoside/pentoside/hexuronide:cation symporter
MAEQMKVVVAEKVPRGYTPAWISRALSLSVNVILLMQITYYATDFAGLSATLVGALLLGSKLFDGFTDLLVGFIINKTNTRLGKARPYELMVVPLWIFTILLFSIPEIGIVGKSLYILILYALINSVCATFLNATDAIYMGRSLSGEQQRAKVLAMNAVVIMLLSAVISILLPQLMANWGPRPGGWTRIGLVLGMPMMILGLGRFFFIKETVVDEKVEQDSKNMRLKESLVILAKNKYVFILAGCILCSNIIQTMMSAVQTYYFQYIVGDLSLMSLFGMLGLFSPFVLLLFPAAMRKFGSMTFIRVGLFTAIAGSILKIFFGRNLVFLVAGQFLSSLGTAPLGMMINLFLIECMEYSEWKTGKRIDGYVPAMVKFSDKVGSGIASGGLGLIMGLAGYNSAVAVQSDRAIASIFGLYTWIPAIICVIMLFLVNLYDLDKKMPRIKQEIAARRSADTVF